MPRTAWAAVALTVVLWASAFAAIRAALDGFSAVELSVLRLLVASLALAAAAPFFGLRRPRGARSPALVAAGALGHERLPVAAQRAASVSVTAGTASLLVSMGPIFVALLAALFLRRADHAPRGGRDRGRVHRRADHRARPGRRRRALRRRARWCSPRRSPGRVLRRPEAAARALHGVRGHRLRDVGGHAAAAPVRARRPGAVAARGRSSRCSRSRCSASARRRSASSPGPTRSRGCRSRPPARRSTRFRSWRSPSRSLARRAAVGRVGARRRDRAHRRRAATRSAHAEGDRARPARRGHRQRVAGPGSACGRPRGGRG